MLTGLASFIAFPISLVAVLASSSLLFLSCCAKSCRRSILLSQFFFHSSNAILAFFTLSFICASVIISYRLIISSVAGFIVFNTAADSPFSFKDLLHLYQEFCLLLALSM